MIPINLNERIECIHTKTKSNLTEKYCSLESYSNQSSKMNINRIKLLFLGFLKQFSTQELDFVITFLKHVLNKYDSSLIDLMGNFFRYLKINSFIFSV